MSDAKAQEIWSKILASLEDKLQFSFLQHAREVVDVKLVGSELTLCVCSDQALEFFTAEVNQQRLQIVSRPFAAIDRFVIQRVEVSLPG